MYPKNSATPITFDIGCVVKISDGSVQTSGVSVVIEPEGGAETAGAGTISYSAATGIVKYTPTQAETNYIAAKFRAYKVGCLPVSVTIVFTDTSTAGRVRLSSEVQTGTVIPEINTLTGHVPQTADHTAQLSSIKTDTGTTIPNTLATIASYIDTEINTILTDLTAVDVVVDGIQADLSNTTDGLGALKALLDAVPTYQTLVDIAALIVRSDPAIENDLSPLLSAINASRGSGAGSYLPSTDGQEVIANTVYSVSTGVTNANNTLDNITIVISDTNSVVNVSLPQLITTLISNLNDFNPLTQPVELLESGGSAGINATELADLAKTAVWSDTLTTYVDGQAGKRVKGLSAVPVVEGIVISASSANTFITDLVGFDDNHFSDEAIIVETGVGTDIWQTKPCIAFNGTASEFVVDEDYTFTPVAGARVVARADHIHALSSIRQDMASQVLLSSLVSSLAHLLEYSANVETVTFSNGTSNSAIIETIDGQVPTLGTNALAGRILLFKRDSPGNLPRMATRILTTDPATNRITFNQMPLMVSDQDVAFLI